MKSCLRDHTSFRMEVKFFRVGRQRTRNKWNNIPFPDMIFSVKLVKLTFPSTLQISNCSVPGPKCSTNSFSVLLEIDQ